MFALHKKIPNSCYIWEMAMVVFIGFFWAILFSGWAIDNSLAA